ncbi:hypothetical protein ACFLTM_02140 [Candidatus Bipolaricaulota bacterium]
MSNRLDLYQLLPAVYRIRDAERGYPLRDLLGIINKQVDIVRQDIDRLWDDFFIETCADWVIPYIGDLVGFNALHDVALPPRADVAKTIYYRRRKGTLPMLEEMAKDVAGWPMHAEAAFELLGWTQNVNHVRYRASAPGARGLPPAVDQVGTAHVRSVDLLDRIDGPFDTLAHTIDVRPMGQDTGRHGIKKVGFHAWRLPDFRMERVPAHPVVSGDTTQYTFSPLGNAAPLFTNTEREAVETERSAEIHVPAPIRPLALALRPADYYGAEKSLWLYTFDDDGAPEGIEISRIRSADLSQWRPPTGNLVAVDVTRGRIAFPTGDGVSDLYVDSSYGFAGEIGGGPYDRSAELADIEGAFFADVGEGGGYESLQSALLAWSSSGKAKGVIRILDNEDYSQSADIELRAGTHLTIEAADGKRPTLRPSYSVSLERIVAIEGEAEIVLSGLLIEGALQLAGEVKLTLSHSTLVPGRTLNGDGEPENLSLASIQTSTPSSAGTTGISVEIDRCILGPIRLPNTCEGLAIRDSIVDGMGGQAIGGLNAGESGPKATIERSTILGSVEVRELALATETIFAGLVQVERLQAGCVRFSFVPVGSRTPRTYRCQPQLALDAKAKEAGAESADELDPPIKTSILSRVVPSFTAESFGHPTYGQLSLRCCEEIRTGAESGAEMGAFSDLRQPQREANLRVRLREYLPFGLESGVIYET